MRSFSRLVGIAAAALVGVAAAAAQEVPQPAAVQLSALSRELLCAPASPKEPPATPIKVAAGRETRKTLFGTGDAVVISGGTAQGVKKGDEYFVRRIVADRFTEVRPGVFPVSIHTVGTVQIIDTHTDASIAVVTYGCDGVIEGDYLERFEPATLPTEERGATPDFSRPARLILAADRRQVAAVGQFMVLDRGSDHGIRAGQLLTIFRPTIGKDGPVATIGTAKVYVVQPERSVVRIESSIDAVYVGDLVAIHR